jgi:membrane-bound lytic murein transglycosylase D
MSISKWVPTAAFISLLLMLALTAISCESSRIQKKPIVLPPVVEAPSPFLSQLPQARPSPAELPKLPVFDQAQYVIDQAEECFRQGEEDYRQGHLDRAKEAFDRAVEVMLRSSIRMQSDERLEKEFDSLVDRIYAYEMVALKAGDAFSAQKYEPAPSDEILSIETFPARIDDKLKATAERELAEVPHDLPIVVNGRVLNFLDYFTHGRGRSTMEAGLRRVGAYRPMFERILNEAGMPRDLIYLAQIESGFQPLALSKKKAKGIWQFVPFRGAEYGLTQTWWVDERQDPEESTRAAARHLKDLFGQFEDWLLALAAYNCGPGNVQRAIERTGYADFWTLADRHVLPLQTENYVPAILAVSIIAKNPEKYGFGVEPAPPLRTERVPVSTPTDLRLIAESIDVPLETLLALNPQLLRMTTPPNQPDFRLTLPAGMKEKFIQEIAAIPEDKRVLWRRHRVASGETLSTIARDYHTNAAAIAQVNGLKSDSLLEEGAKIIIPATLSGKKTVAVKHRVERGETLASIATKYDVAERDLRKWNRMGPTAKIQTGQRLTVRMVGVEKAPRAETAAQTRAKKSFQAASANRPSRQPHASIVHSVKPGETLSSIAANYNTTVQAIKQLNGIEDAHRLRIGERLRISVGQ